MVLGKARHLREQLPVIAAMGRLGLAAARQRISKPSGELVVPGPELCVTVPARERALIDDYLRHVGGDPTAYRGAVPAHLFPQWSFPVQARGFAGINYPIAKILNAGCRLQINSMLPDREPLTIRTHLTEVDDDGYRVILHMRVITETPSTPNAVVADIQALIPLKRRPKGEKKDDAPRNLVPADAESIATYSLKHEVGLQFAMLTGDFNPVHWVRPWARMSGFKSTIVHGFATMARAMESLIEHRFDGDPAALASFECRFTRPLVMPATVKLWVSGKDVFVGDAPQTKAYLTGTFGGRPE